MNEEPVQATTAARPEVDLAEAVRRVLRASPEPLTVSKIRAALPAPHRQVNPDELTDHLTRQVAAAVLYQFPKYRSPQDRFWDRPMPVHLAALVRDTLREKPLTPAELRRKLPTYAQGQAEGVVREQLAQGTLYRHPRGGRQGERYGTRPPDPKAYLRPELAALFERLGRLGFTPEQLRAGTLELLHDEEWASAVPESEPSLAPGPSYRTPVEDEPPAEGGLSR